MVARSSGRAALQSMQHRPGGLAFAQVAGHRLAEHFFGGGQVEHVVDNLERHAEIAAIVGELLLVGFGSLRQNSAQLHAHGKQARRLAIDQFEMLVDGDGLAEALDLQQFALDHRLRQLDERVEDLEVTFLRRRS